MLNGILTMVPSIRNYKHAPILVTCKAEIVQSLEASYRIHPVVFTI